MEQSRKIERVARFRIYILITTAIQGRAGILIVLADWGIGEQGE